MRFIQVMGLKKSRKHETGLSIPSQVAMRVNESTRSAAEAVEGASLALKGVHDIEGRDGLPAGVFSVGDGILHNVLEEATEDGAGLLVDVRRDALDATTAGESADSGLGDAHDGGADRLLLALGSVLATLGLSVATDLCFSWHCPC